MRRRINIFASIDWITVILFLLMVFLGWINIYAADYEESHPFILDTTKRYGIQFFYILTALVLAFIVIIIDLNFFSFFAYPVYGLILLFLLVVLFLGFDVHGSRSWFALGPVNFQPSEFSKFATGLALAKYIGRKEIKMRNLKHIAVALLIILSPAVLIALQPDWGTVMVFSAFVIVLFREGMPYWMVLVLLLVPVLFIVSLAFPPVTVLLILTGLGFGVFALLNQRKKMVLKGFFLIVFMILGGAFLYQKFDIPINRFYFALGGIGLIVLFFLIISLVKKIKFVPLAILFFVLSVAFTQSVDYFFDHILLEHQQKRISVMLGLESDSLGVGYNVAQSKIAIGSGGLTGKGFLRGTQTKFDFVPEQSTDFIFCTVGEEWGFMGTTLVVLLFVALLLRLIFLAERQRTAFARVYAYAVVAVIFFHFAVNVAMTIGLFPVIGIPLPFFSYGGSSLWGFTILLFILINLDTKRLQVLG